MKITVTTLTEHIFSLDVSPDMELENFKALVAIELGFEGVNLIVTHDGVPLLDDKKDLKFYGIREGDVVLVQQIPAASSGGPTSTPGGGGAPVFDFGSIRVPAAGSTFPDQRNDPEYIRNTLLSNPEQLALLRQNNPALASALDKGSAEFKRVLEEQQKARAEQERMRIRMLQADPFDSEAQRLIDEEIRRKNIDSNMEAAMEYHPESFGSVTMLYINCKVNGHPVKAFIDSGAQSTIMSGRCAERCHITRLIDNRWAGIAKGVGVQKIVGRVHLCQIQIEKDFLPSSFIILQNQDMDMMLGLDMLKRHQCCIDLKRNVLVIGTTGTETRFLNEGEIPLHLRGIGDKESVENELLNDAINRSAQESRAQSSGKSHSESVIRELMSYGFDRERVLQELNKSNGNKEKALAALLAQGLRMPN